VTCIWVKENKHREIMDIFKLLLVGHYVFV
jgi:hypothetical protein